MFTVYKEYLFNLFWPLHLSAVYEVDIKTAIDAEVIWSFVLLFVTFATLWLHRRGERRSAVFWLALFFLGFAPVSQIIPINTLMNDRYFYFPLLGGAVYLPLLLKSIGNRMNIGEKIPAGVVVVCLLLLMPVAWKQAGLWSDSVTLWEDTVKQQPNSAMAWKMLGNSYRKSGNIQAAIDGYLRSLAINPSNYEHNYELGVLYHDAGEFDKAIVAYRNAFFLKPDHISTIYNLGLVYTTIGQFHDAVSILSRGDKVSPDSLDVKLLLAANHYILGQFDAAKHAYKLAENLAPDSAAVASYLSLVLMRQGKLLESQSYQKKAVSLGMPSADIYLDWARLEAVGQHREQALDFIKRALMMGVKNSASLYSDPDFGRLKDDEEFVKLVKRKK